MSHTTLQFTMDDGVIIQAEAWGDPTHPPVLFAHGGGQTRHAWGKAAHTLSEQGWYTVAYDHRGHGQSGWAPTGHYKLEHYARDQMAIAKQLGQAPVLVGASLGGLSAMLAHGEFDRELYQAIILVDITPNMDRSGAMNVLKFMAENVNDGFATLEDAATAIAAYTGRPLRGNLDGLKKNLRQDATGRYFWHWDPNFLKLGDDLDASPARLMAAVKTIETPILLVRGQLSELVTEDVAKAFLEMVPHAEFVDVEHARHMVAGDKNDIFNQAISEFLDKLRQRSETR